MIFSKTSTYALRILILMSMGSEAGYSAKYLHEKLAIPQRYLRRLLTDLSRSGFIRSLRGRNGGFVFARPIESIYLAEIVDTVEGLDAYKTCILGVTDCKMINLCSMHDTWVEIRDNILHTLSTTSLKDLKEQGMK